MDLDEIETNQENGAPGLSTEYPPVDHGKEQSVLVADSVQADGDSGDFTLPDETQDHSSQLEQRDEDDDEAEESQVWDLEVLPDASDTGVQQHIKDIQEKLNIKHVLNCLRTRAVLLRIATNVVATDATQLVKVQDLQFSLIKLCDAVSLMMQNDQSGANNILEKLKIAYLYLQDGFPDFAQTDIEVISKDVKSMEQATQKCLSKIEGAKKSEEEVLKMAQGRLEDRMNQAKYLVDEIAAIKRRIEELDPFVPPLPELPQITGPTPPVSSSFWQKVFDAAMWQKVFDAAINGLLQTGIQAVREITGSKTSHPAIDLAGNQNLINILWSRPSSDPFVKKKEPGATEEKDTLLKSVLGFVAPVAILYVAVSRPPWRHAAAISGGFGIPWVVLHLKYVSPTPPLSFEFNPEYLEPIQKLMGCDICLVGLRHGATRLDFKHLDNALGYVSDSVGNISQEISPFTWGTGFFILTCIKNKVPWQALKRACQALHRTWQSHKKRQKAVPPPRKGQSNNGNRKSELEELKAELNDRRGALTKMVDDVYLSKMAILSIEKALPLLGEMCVILDWATKLVETWYNECKEIVEPNMQHNIDRAEGLSEDGKRKYWDSLFFKQEVKGYYERWRGLQVFCERNRPALKNVRQVCETYYTENLYPRDAVVKAWELAGQEPDEEIKSLVARKDKWSTAKGSCKGLIEDVVPADCLP